MFSPGKAISLSFARFFSMQGRSSRSEYWFSSIFFFVLTFIVAIVCIAIAEANKRNDGVVGLSFLVLGIVYLFFTIATLFMGVRRLHDRDMSGWWMLLLFIPFGSLILFVIFVLPGTPGLNRFGVNPVEDLMGHFTYYTTKQHKRFGAYGAQQYAASVATMNAMQYTSQIQAQAQAMNQQQMQVAQMQAQLQAQMQNNNQAQQPMYPQQQMQPAPAMGQQQMPQQYMAQQPQQVQPQQMPQHNQNQG